MVSEGIKAYFTVALKQLEDILASQHEALEKFADIWADAIKEKHLLYAFGSGHSRFIAGELYFRAGGLAPVMTMDDPSLGKAERLEGYAETFIHHYPIEAGDIMLVISNSGINPLPIEVAAYAKAQGAKVIALSNLSQSQNAKSRHSSGKKLYEFADLILDTKGFEGDAAVSIPGYDWQVGPTSTLASVAMLNAVVTQTAFNLAGLGISPPVLLSSNAPGGDIHNQAMIDSYWPRLSAFPLRKISSG